MRLKVAHQSAPLLGELRVPASKYHAHRALILASLAPGTSRIDGLSDAGHVHHTLGALRALGVRIDVEEDTFVVHGVGGQFRPVRPDVSVGSSGTTLYFLTGLVSLAAAPVTVVGQKYFQRRPIGPLLRALQGMGVQLSSPTDTPPIRVEPVRPSGGAVSIAGTLSQWISGLLVLAPFATGPSVITVEGEYNERSYIDLTVRMMAQFGLHVEVSADGRRFEVEGDQQIHPTDLVLPPDVGSAAFGLAIASLHPSDVLFRGLRSMDAAVTDHPEADLLDIVRAMGVPATLDDATGFVRVRNEGVRLSAVEVDCRRVPDMLPVLAAMGTFAEGTTRFDNVAHVRLKESDRVTAMLQLNRAGARLEQRGESLFVHGLGAEAVLRGAGMSSFNDHRVLMSLAVAATRADGESFLTYPNAYRISYPRFLDEMNGIGASMATVPTPRSGRTTRPAVDPARVAEVPLDLHVRRWSAERSDELAVVDLGVAPGDERTWTWRELDAEADRVAALLLELGVQQGDTVAFQLPNRAEFVAILLATARIGAVATPLMPIFRRREMEFLLRRSAARVLFVPEEFRGRRHADEIAELLEEATTLRLEHVVVLGRSVPGSGDVRWHDYTRATTAQVPDRAALDARRPEPSAISQLLFTSGTSGEPKGVLHRMDAQVRASAMEIAHLGLTESDRIFIPTPLAHQTGLLYGMGNAFVLGVAQVLQPIWDGRRGLEALTRWEPTFVQAATPFLADLVDAVEETGVVPEALRIFVATGTAVPRGLAERATRVLGAAVCGAWGSTETCLGALAAPGDEPAKVWGTDGRALAGVRLRITDDTGREVAPGVEGNYEVRSDCLFTGYLDRPDLTAEVFTADGWYRTGDLAAIDESGFLRISGRVKDVVNRGGEKVPVAEVEQLLHTHPAIKEAAVVAMPDERLGERACAFAVVLPGNELTFAEVQRFLDEAHVAKQYWPERLETISSLPRNPAGKVQKFLLREQVRTMIEEQR